MSAALGSELLRRYRVLDTTSADVASAHMSKEGGAHHVLGPGRSCLRHVENHAALAGWDLAYSARVGPATRLEAPVGSRWYLLHLRLQGAGTYHLRHRSLACGQGQAVLLAPHVGFVAERGEGESSLLILRLPAAELRGGEGRARRKPRLAETPVDPAAFASLRRTLLFTAAELDESTSSLATSPTAQRLVLSLLKGLLIAAFEVSERSWPLPVPQRPAVERLRRAEDWIEANLQGRVTLTELSAATGVGARTVQLDFQREHGCTPMAFLRDRRLQRSHLLLSRPREGTTVTEAAYRCGFTHLGRFSSVYRQSFGERPSDTLSKARS